MATRKWAAVALVAAVALTGCITQPPRDESETAPARTEVDWSSYPPAYQATIDEEAAELDCEALQEMFDVAPDDADLLAYIDEALRLADCY